MREAFLRDGRILNQAETAAVRYGAYGSDYNGCGWIAAHNLLTAAGRSPDWRRVHDALEATLRFGGALGTSPVRLRRFLEGEGLRFRVAKTRRAALRLAETALLGIAMFACGRGHVHFVAFRREGAAFRFENAAAGAPEPLMTMEAFLKRFCRFPLLYFMAVEE